jgi:4-amino-4-deoxy-L-arabinose transferase-like glycosyltransferase
MHFVKKASIPLFLICVCLSHIHQGTLAVDAVRYAHIAQLIVEDGNWFSLYDAYDERPYANKPPLLFWILAGLFKVFGFSTFIAKLPSCLFAFSGMLLLWHFAKQYAGERTALFVLVAFALSPFTGKDLIDLNFEGFAFFGSLLSLVSLFYWDKTRNSSFGFLYGVGLFFLLQSKPPYVLLVLLPTVVWLLFVVREIPVKCFLLAIPFSFLGVSWFFLAGDEYASAAVQNQVEGPLTLTRGFFYNIYLWILGFFEEFPFAATGGVWGIFTLVFSWKRISAFQKLLIIWVSFMIPVILLVDGRPRYLLIPVLPLLLISGEVFSRMIPFSDIAVLKKALFFVSLLLVLLFAVGGVLIHRSDTLVILAKKHSILIDAGLGICSDHKKDYRNWSAAKNTQLLMRLETGKEISVKHSGELLESRSEEEFLVNARCFDRLQVSDLEIEVLEEFSKGVRKIRLGKSG